MNSAFTNFLPQIEDDHRDATKRQHGTNVSNWQTSWTTLLASASRTATTISSGIDTLGYRGVLFVFENTTTDGTLAITLATYLPAGLGTAVGFAHGNSFNVPSTSERGLLITPDCMDRDSVGVGGFNYPTDFRRLKIPNLIRVAVVHSSANPLTYRVRYVLIP